MRVINGSAPRPRSALRAAYEEFRLDRQGELVSPRTLEYYDDRIGQFLDWLAEERPEIRRVGDLDVGTVREYRAYLSGRLTRSGRPLRPKTIAESHTALMTFLKWAQAEGYEVQGRILELRRPRVPAPEPTVYHVAQLREVLQACDPARPEEGVAVRILVGSGVRESELCGLAVVGPDGLPDLMLDSLQRGRVELRVRWDAGAKGMKSRRVPITPKLASAIKRYEGRYRRDVEYPNLLINRLGQPYKRYGIDAMMDRLQRRVGFRVHAHGFRHTFATVATQLGWNLEHVRAAMGHADYTVLQRYVRLATERDLGSRKDWVEFVVANPALASSW